MAPYINEIFFKLKVYFADVKLKGESLIFSLFIQTYSPYDVTDLELRIIQNYWTCIDIENAFSGNKQYNVLINI